MLLDAVLSAAEQGVDVEAVRVRLCAGCGWHMVQLVCLSPDAALTGREHPPTVFCDDCADEALAAAVARGRA